MLGNYSMGLQVQGKAAFLELYSSSQDLYQTILAVMESLPLAKFSLLLLAVTMIAFYATSFDALTLVASTYSYKELTDKEEPDKKVKLFWALLLILFPIALIFNDSSMANLQSVSIIAAFPIGFIMLLIIGSFFRDAGHYLEEKTQISPLNDSQSGVIPGK